MKNSFFKRLYILLSISILVGYLSVLTVGTHSVLGSCFTSLLRVYKQEMDPLSIVTNSYSVANIIGVIVASYLWYRFLKGVFLIAVRYIKYRTFIRGLTATESKGIHIIQNVPNLVFTAGFRNPNIWISENLVNELNKKELKAVIAHERKHLISRDTLWKTLNEFIQEALPPVPRLREIIDKFNVVIELSADEYAIENTNTGALLSALLVIMKKTTVLGNPMLIGLTGVVGLSANSERIQILTKKKKFNYIAVGSYASFIILGFLFTATFLTTYNVFDHCDNPEECIYTYTSDEIQTVNPTEKCTEVSSTQSIPQSQTKNKLLT